MLHKHLKQDIKTKFQNLFQVSSALFCNSLPVKLMGIYKYMYIFFRKSFRNFFIMI